MRGNSLELSKEQFGIMANDSQILRIMLMRIAELFHFMSDNKELRLYYLVPLLQNSPYAYQHSSIRDVATLCDILDLLALFKEKEITLISDAHELFEKITKNTLHAYHALYQSDELPNLNEGNIGDIGFFLLAMQKCHSVYPAQLPNNWQETKVRLIKQLLKRQNASGSMQIFFDNSLNSYQTSVEAFYLPEALIGLIACIGTNSKEIDDQLTTQVQKAISYCCQGETRKQNLASDTATFYANWQFQLLYHWIQKKQLTSVEIDHIEKIILALSESRIANDPFGSSIATVEVACYMEGLVHAERTLELLNKPTNTHEKWFEKEINRSLRFLYEVQNTHLDSLHGGFAHSLYSYEARIDVAGHVFSGLQLLF